MSSLIPLAAGAIGGAIGAMSEKEGWNIPNYRDIGNIMQGRDTGVESNAFYQLKQYLARPDVEGYEKVAYLDSLGILTVGIGHKVLPEDNIKLGQAISDQRVADLFEKDARKAFDAAVSQAREIGKYNVQMIVALGSVNFQLGTGWRSKFPNTWSAIKTGNIQTAINNLKQSKWAEQTPVRVTAFINTLLSQYA